MYAMAQPSPVQLLNFITATFDLEELQTLCFQLYVPYDDLAGQTREGKARELIEFMQRVGRTGDLVATLAHERPIAWEQTFGTEQFAAARQAAAQPRPRDPRQVFLSHAHQDNAFAHRLAGDLRERGYSVWIAPESIRPGERWVDAINRGLKESGIFLLVSTPSAVDSQWVQDETSYAIELAAKEKIRFIRLNVTDAEVPPMWSVRQYISFGNYASGLANLERALETPGAAPASSLAGDDQARTTADSLRAPVSSQGDVPAATASPASTAAKSTGVPRWLAPVGIVAAVVLILGGVLAYNRWIAGGNSEPSTAAAASSAGDALATLAAQQSTPAATPDGIQTRTVTLADGVVSEQVYVPAGSFAMGREDVSEEMLPVHAVSLDAFWLDRTEVTNAQYAACVADGSCVPPSDQSSDLQEAYYGNAEFADFPVVFVSWPAAAAFCQWAGGRLPTEAEWEYAARGPSGNLYPWGNASLDTGLLNYNSYIGDPMRVGSYPVGASWVGAHDLAGNVFEWVADYYASDYYYRSPGENPTGPQSGSTRAARGGSFASEGYLLDSARRFEEDPDYTSVEVGFRCAYDANSRLVTIPGGLAVEQVRVPAGMFNMGAEGNDADEAPIHPVALRTFWLDRTEVTNAQFEAFAGATGYATVGEAEGGGWSFDGNGWGYIEGADWRHPAGPESDIEGLDNHPVVIVAWQDAQAYCRWVGGDLPTEAQWEYAARGPESAVFPWGDEYDRENLNYCDQSCVTEYTDQDNDDGYVFSSPVGTYPDGASWVGAVDMLGNVWEWVRDWYGATYYARSPGEDPPGPDSGTQRVVRGGSWNDVVAGVSAADRVAYEPGDHDLNLGFRCAYED